MNTILAKKTIATFMAFSMQFHMKAFRIGRLNAQNARHTEIRAKMLVSRASPSRAQVAPPTQAPVAARANASQETRTWSRKGRGARGPDSGIRQVKRPPADGPTLTRASVSARPPGVNAPRPTPSCLAMRCPGRAHLRGGLGLSLVRACRRRRCSASWPCGRPTRSSAAIPASRLRRVHNDSDSEGSNPPLPVSPHHHPPPPPAPDQFPALLDSAPARAQC
jgi:hypothetical protein